jgi:hypothetical protein
MNSYQNVWQETNRLFNQMIQIDNWPALSGQTISFQDSHHMAQKLALYIILSCGFGMPMEWNQEADTTKHKITLTEAVETQRNSLIFLSLAPKWIQNLPTKRYSVFDSYHRPVLTDILGLDISGIR